MVTITPNLSSKKPEEEFGPSTFWVTEEGHLSTQHPRQSDMFSGPRDAGGRETATPSASQLRGGHHGRDHPTTPPSETVIARHHCAPRR